MANDFTLFYNWDPSDPPRFHSRAIDRAYFDWLFDMLEGTGVTFLYRCNLAGRAYYPSSLMSRFDHGCIDHRNEKAQFWHRVADMLDGADPLADAVDAARRHGVAIWVWWNWNEFQNVREGWLNLADPLWYERPRNYWCTRDGSRFYHGIPDFGNPQVQRRLVGLAEETASYGVDGLYLSTRSHSWCGCWPSPGWADHLEPFGFNDSVVDACRKRFGIDIRYEDFDAEALDRLKGEHFTQLITHTGGLLHGLGKSFVIGISPNRYELCVDFETPAAKGKQGRPGGPCLHLYKDWEGWAAAGSVDGICAEQSCPAETQVRTADTSAFRSTLPADFPLYTWADTAHYVNRGFGPFNLHNWDRNSVEQVIEQVASARAGGAAGTFLHSLYHYTACDGNGETLAGYGDLPRREYFDALRENRGRWA